ncbi:MAG: quinone-dependent dihydroorotate dehydrogenase, partial [Solirubrobacteraceae bacterium]
MIYRLFFTLVLRRIDAERAHALAAGALRGACAVPGVRRLLRALLAPRDTHLEVRALGCTFPSPLGSAAGMDKDVTWFEELGALGFGFVEVGTVTPAPQDGNVMPRTWRLPEDRGLLNHMGFPNPGAASAAEQLRRRSGRTVVGANIGRGSATPSAEAGADYRATTRQLASLCDFLVLNVSSPNTQGLRDLQSAELLGGLIDEVRDELAILGERKPLLVKLGPDLTDAEIDALADLAVARRVDGLVATNTTTSRAGLRSDPRTL